MTGKVTCPGCGARLTYRGSPKGTRNCPKCQTSIAFDGPLSSPPSASDLYPPTRPIEAEAVIESESQAPTVTPVPTKDSSKRSPLVFIVMGGLAAGLAGLMVLMVLCTGVAVFIFSRGDDPVAFDATDGSGVTSTYAPVAYDSKAGDYSTYSAPSYAAEPYPSPSYDSSVAPSSDYSSTASSTPAPPPYDPFRTAQQPPPSGGFTFNDLLGFLGSAEGGYEEPAEEWGTVSEAQREAIRQQQSDYYRYQAENAERWGNHEEAAQFRHYSENP